MNQQEENKENESIRLTVEDQANKNHWICKHCETANEKENSKCEVCDKNRKELQIDLDYKKGNNQANFQFEENVLNTKNIVGGFLIVFGSILVAWGAITNNQSKQIVIGFAALFCISTAVALFVAKTEGLWTLALGAMLGMSAQTAWCLFIVFDNHKLHEVDKIQIPKYLKVNGEILYYTEKFGLLGAASQEEDKAIKCHLHINEKTTPEQEFQKNNQIKIPFTVYVRNHKYVIGVLKRPSEN